MALSKTQSKRLGAILSVMFNEEAPADVIAEIIQAGYVIKDGDNLILTAQGNDERNRLSTLAGLNIKYRSERNKETTKATKSLDAKDYETAKVVDIEKKT